MGFNKNKSKPFHRLTHYERTATHYERTATQTLPILSETTFHTEYDNFDFKRKVANAAAPLGEV